MSSLIIASNNIHKISEIEAFLEGTNIKILSAGDLDDFPQILEDGETINENAIIKATGGTGAIDTAE